MKFGNRLKEERNPRWEEEYIEYKLLKKKLNILEQHDSAAEFCRLLEEQLIKVAAFMRAQQESISEELDGDPFFFTGHSSAEADGPSPEGPQSKALARCQTLETQIDHFREYVRLNQDGIRKIVKKFDKRFHTSFKEVYPVAPTQLPFGVREIQAWMLDPTIQLLKLMRQRDLVAHCPLRQINFWVQELKIGCQLAREKRFSFDFPLTPLRLQLRDDRPEDVRLVVKNTFICGIGEDEDPVEQDRADILRRCRAYSADRGVDVSAADKESTLSSEEDTDHLRDELSADEERFGPSSPPWTPEMEAREPYGSQWAAANQSFMAMMPIFLPEPAMCQTFGLSPPQRDTTFLASEQVFRRELLGPGLKDDADRKASLRTATSARHWESSRDTSESSAHSPHAQRSELFPGPYLRYGASDCISQDRVSSHGTVYQPSSYNEYIPGGRAQVPDARGPGPPHLQMAVEHLPHSRQSSSPFMPASACSASAKGGSGPSSSSRPGRWWMEVNDACAVSGFPVRMLPYPPFKLRAVMLEGKSSVVLVDGQYLILQVLATWEFQALGRALDMSDISSLDKYIQQSKLGPWRLGKALELFSEGSGKHAELEALRARARRKLETLRHIQRSRVSQGEQVQARPAGCQGRPAGTQASRPRARGGRD